MSFQSNERVFDFYLLEDRILLSAEGFDAAHSAPNADVEILDAMMAQLLDSDSENAADKLFGDSPSKTSVEPDRAESNELIDAPVSDASRRLEVVFVDAGVEDADVLLAGLRSQSPDGTQWSIIRLSSEQDGIAQISRTLDLMSGVDAVHLLSHASDDGIQLGNTRLDMSSVTAHAGSIARWAGALDAEADLLIYGCDLASSQNGRDLIETLAAVCDCDVAASDDLTGHQTLGGDWELEYAVGTIETLIAFDAEAQQAWQHVLAAVDATFQEGVGGYTGTQDTDFNGDSPNSSYGNETSITVDDDHNNGIESVGLLRFDSIFGNGPGQIPLGSTIVSASLTINGTNASHAAATLSLHQMLTSWSESSTYNSLGSGLQSGTEYVAAADGSITDLSSTGLYTITGLEDALQSWSDGGTNHGWALFNDNANGFNFDSSEEATASLRPELSIQYIAPNSAPVLTASSPNGLFTENGGHIYDAYATVTDSDSADFDGGDLTVTITTNATANDRLEIRNVGTGPGQISTSGSNVYYEGNLIGTFSGGVGTTALTVSLNVNADVTAVQGLARAVAFNNVSEDPSTATRIISAVLSDGDGGTSAASNINMHITAVNDEQVLATNVGATVLEGSAGNVINTAMLQTTDVDNQASELVYVVDSTASNGTLYRNGVALGATDTFTQSDIDAGLITYDHDGGETTSDGFAFTVDDGAGATSSSSFNWVVTAVNDAPVLDNSGDMTLTPIFENDDRSNGTLVSDIIGSAGGDRITDADIGAVEGIAITAVDDSNGQWQFSIDGGATWQPIATAADNSAILLTTTANDRLRFLPDRNFSGVAQFTFRAWDTSDGNLSGAIGVDVSTNGGTTAYSSATETATIQMLPVDIKILLSTAGDASNSSTVGLNGWQSEDIVSIGDPDFNIEPGTSSGTFGLVTDFLGAAGDVGFSLNALHYVGQNITLGQGGFTFDLLVGDILLTVDRNVTFTGDGTSISVTNEDIFVFRPVDPANNDYRTGDFFELLHNPGGVGNEILGVSLVQADVDVGGTILTSGSFILSSADLSANNIYHFTPDQVGAGAASASGTLQTLIYGDDLGLGGATNAVQSLDLVQSEITINGRQFLAGDIFVSLEKSDNDVSGLRVTKDDVAFLRLTQAGSGVTTQGSVGLFFEGGDTGLNSSNDEITTLGTIIAGGVADPVIGIASGPIAYTEGDGQVAIDSGATLTDSDSLNFYNGQLRVQITTGGTADDRLAVQDQGLGVGQVGVSGNLISYNDGGGAVTIGTFTGGTSGTDPLAITFNSQADLAAVQAVMQAVTFENVSDSPDTQDRAVEMVLSDGDGGTSNVAGRSISVSAVNDPVVASDESYSISESGQLSTGTVWWDNSWVARRALTFDNLGRTENLTDFAVLIQLDASRIDYGLTQNAGQDLRFIDADGVTVLDHEIEQWNEGGISYVWVRIPQIDAASDSDGIWMYYGNSAAADGQSVDGTWNADFVGVYHLNDDFLDSSGTGNHANNLGSTDAVGQFADGQVFDGVSDDINAGSDASLDNLFVGGGTLSAWINPTGWGGGNYGNILDKSSATNADGGWGLQVNAGNQSIDLEVGFSGGGRGVWSTATGSVTLGQWQHVVVVYDSSSTANIPVIYINGVAQDLTQVQTPTGTADDDSAKDFHIGNFAGATTRSFDGTIDEVRVARIVQSADWTSAQHASMTDRFVRFADEGILTNDLDADQDTLTVTAINPGTGSAVTDTVQIASGVTPPSGAIVAVSPNGRISYDPNGQFEYLAAGESATETFTYQVSDGNGSTDIATVTITINGENDAPGLATNIGLTVNEGSVANALNSSVLNEGDVDDDGNELTYTITSTVAAGSLRNNGTLLGVNDTFTQADVDAGLITYDHDGSESTSDSFAFSLADGGEDGASQVTGTFVFTVNAVNDMPVESSIEGSTLSYTENDGAVAITSTLALSDSDDTNLESAVVQITGDYANGQDVLTFVDQNGISGVWNAGSGTLTLTGTATVTQYQAALRSITYTNTSDNPSTATRTVSFTVNDGDVDSNTQTRDISIAATNDDPTGTGLPSDIAVTEDVSSNVDLSALNLSDVDANSGSLTVTLSTSAGGNLTASSGGGVTVGGSGTGTLTLTGTLADLNTFLDTPANVQYLHGTPHTFGNDADTIQVVVNDGGNTGSGGGTDQTVGTVNVDITAVNDEQVLATNAGDTVAEGSTGNTVTTAMFETTDVDNTDSQLVYTVDAVPTNGTLYRNGVALNVSDTFTQADIDAGLISYDHDGSNTTGDSFDFTVDDGAGTTTSSTFNWTVTATNDAPVESSIEGSTLSYTENDGAVAITSTLAPSDSDDTNLESAVVQITGNYANGQDVLTFVDQNGISGVWNAGSGTLTLTGTATVAQYQAALRSITYTNTSDNPSAATRTVSFTVNDGDVNSNIQTRDISVAATNDDPTGTGLPSDITVTEDVSSNVDLSALNLSDVDANSGNLTVTLSTSTGGNLSAIPGGGVTVGGSGTGTLALTGTLSDLNTFLDTPANVQYLHGTPHTFGNDADTIQVVVNDGGNTGSGGGTDQTVGIVNVDITAVNDEQVLAANTGDTVTEGSTGNTVTTAMLETTDVDNTDSQLVYTVDAVPTNGTLYRNGVALNVSDTFTQADIDAGLISYDHDGSDTVSDSFDFTVDDGAGTTTSSTFNWTVTAANDAPVEASIEGTTLAYTENDGAVVITSTLALSDSDDTNLESAIVQITGNYANGQDVLAFVDQNGISGVWNAGSGTLTLTGTATVAQYQAALRSITYTNTSDNPSTATRTVSFTVNDGDVDSNTQTRNISIAATNDDPTGTGLPSDITVTEDVSSNVDLSALNLNDVDANSGNLTVTLSTSTGGNLSASSGGGVTVGGNGTGTLTLTGTLTDLNTFLDTPANVQYLHGTPHTFGDDADTIQVVVNDGGNTGSGGGTDQTIGTVNVDITAVNDEQVLATNTGDTVTEGSTGNTVTTAMLETTDVDNTDSQLVYTVDTVPTNGTLYRNGVALNVSDTFTQADIDAGLISYDHDGSNTTSDSFDFTVDDGVGTTTSSTFNWTVTASNAAPVATGESFTVNIGETLTVGVSSVIFNDSDVDGDSLAIVLVAAPTNGSFTLDPGGNFTYTPNPGFFGQDSFLYQVTDGTLLSNVAEAVLEVPLALLATSGTTETSSETEPEPEPETEDFTEPESDPPSEIESQGEESTDPSDATETTSPAGDVVPAVVMDGSGDKAGGDANRTSGAGNGGDDTGLPNEVMAIEAERQLYGIYAASEEASSLTMGYSPELQQLERLLRQDLQQAIVWTQWDEAPEDDENQMTVMVGAAGAGMSVFSIGYVFWALRGGTLMTVFASSLPAWRFIDPIAMLSAYRSSKPGFDEGLDGLIK